jgi:hypothetical protein
MFIRKGTVMLFEQGVHRLSAIGLRRESAFAIMAEVDKWRRNNGEEWTVERLKSIKVDFARHLAGLPPVALWVSRHPDGSPKGPFHAIWKLPKQQLFKAWNALMVYSGFVFTHPSLRCSDRQYRKFLYAVRRRDPDALCLVRAKELIDLGLPPGQRPDPMVTRPLLHMYPKASVNSPVYMGGSVPQEQGILDSIRALAHNISFVEKYREQVMPVIQGFEGPFEVLLYDSVGPATIGRVCWIQEKGYKLRFVASPFPVYQRLLQPLGDYLFNYLKGIKEDCTFEQEKGLLSAQTALLSGKCVYSYDLSNCSDHLPLSLQTYLMRQIGVEEQWVQMFEDISTGLWQLQDGHPTVKKLKWPDGSSETVDDNFIRWRVGQPLGLYPSFAAFALLHHSLVRGLAHTLGLDCREGYDYRILGDDIIIYNDVLGLAYPRLMESLGVPISETKTLVSNQVCEFAGRVIMRDKIVQGYKWKGKTDDSFIDVVRNLGPSSMALCTPRQRAVLSVLAPVPEPYGFGWNPEGLTYAERLGDWELANRVVKDRAPAADTRSRNMNRLLYGSYKSFHVQESNIPASLASDLDAFMLVSRTLKLESEVLAVPLLANVCEVPSDGTTLRKEILADYGRLEAVSHCSALIKKEREIRKVEKFRVLRNRRYPSWVAKWRLLIGSQH